MAEGLIRLKTKIKRIALILGYDIGNGHISRVRINRPSGIFVKELFGNKPLVGAEVGVYSGENSENLVQNINFSKFYAIDSWVPWEGSKRQLKEFKMAERLTRKRLSKYGKKCVIIKKKSDDAVKDILEKLDFVYIDGDHDYLPVKKDIELYYKLLKKGGVIAGHDINNGLQENGVAKAVSEFSIKNNLDLRVQAPDWWIVKK
ncbi:MAG: class I SAM-dependent methyltransferase [Candidatus Pacearchaeota archaeon]